MNTTKNDLSNMKVELKLADGSIYPVLGKVQFVDNQIDPTAGTIALRATFPNEKGLLVPGDYINVVASSTKPRKVVLVPQVAVSDSTNGYFVYYIDKDNKAQIKPIKVDAPMGDFWIVKEGLSAGDKIVTKGLQKLAPGMPVKIEEQTASENKMLRVIRKKNNNERTEKEIIFFHNQTAFCDGFVYFHNIVGVACNFWIEA
jgi:membrane fusion protein (multidrug efflux system)